MSVSTILPDNATALELALERVLVGKLNSIPSPFPSLWRPDEAALSHLPWLAEALGVTEWNSSASESEKRASLAAQWPSARQGGMAAAIKRAIEPLGFGVLLKPWYEFGGDPYSFQIELTLGNNPIQLSLLSRVEQRLNDAKSERDTYEIKIILEDINGSVVGAESAAYVGALFTDVVTAESLPFASTIESLPG